VIVPNNNNRNAPSGGALIKRVFIKTIDDEDDDAGREYHVFSESDRGSPSLLKKFRRKEEAVNFVRETAKKNGMRFSGEEARRVG
jgi:hypothetical protein